MKAQVKQHLNGTTPRRGKIVATYDYRDEAGKLLFQVVRYATKSPTDPKVFSQRRPSPDGKGGWVDNVNGVRRVLYHLPELLANDQAQVFIVEGEKDADRLASLGLIATTNSGGAGKWLDGYADSLRGRNVVILPDNDAPGRRHAAKVRQSLQGVAASVKTLSLPGLPPKGDVSDWLDVQGQGREQLLLLVATAGSTALPPEFPEEAWTPPVLLGEEYDVPEFPRGVLPSWLEEWVDAIAEATQTPRDLAALISTTIYGAGWARKVRVQVRTGWTEPTNLFTATALPSGERKTPVFEEARLPVDEYEQSERERMAPIIARAASEHRMIEARLKAAETKAAKATDTNERDQAKHEAKGLAEDLDRHKVPADPVLVVDDETPESIGQVLAVQGGRLLQASAEGTPIEIVKGRYSNQPNFDVHLKAHAGDTLRTGRVGRQRETVFRPALSVALAVQPDVIRGLAEVATMVARGYVARYLFAIPRSRLGSRKVAAPPVPAEVRNTYRAQVRSAWSFPLPPADGPEHLLHFSSGGNRAIREFEEWLEPQLAPGAELSHLAGWANKLAGATARVAAVLHLGDHADLDQAIITLVSEDVVRRAIRLSRDYLIPHAKAAFGLMGADPTVEAAKKLLACLARHKDMSDFTRTELWRPLRSSFRKPEDLDQALGLLVSANYLRCHTPERPKDHRGAWPPRYLVNPLWKRDAFSTNCTNSTNGTQGKLVSAVGAVSAGGREPGDDPEEEDVTTPWDR